MFLDDVIAGNVQPVRVECRFQPAKKRQQLRDDLQHGRERLHAAALHGNVGQNVVVAKYDPVIEVEGDDLALGLCHYRRSPAFCEEYALAPGKIVVVAAVHADVDMPRKQKQNPMRTMGCAGQPMALLEPRLRKPGGKTVVVIGAFRATDRAVDRAERFACVVGRV